MFERMTERARRSLVLAQEEARQLGATHIGTEHLLLGLIHEGEGVAARSLNQLGITTDAVRTQIGATGDGPSDDQVAAVKATPIARALANFKGDGLKFTSQSKKALEFSLREALALGHNYIGTEHLLLGLVRQKDGLGTKIVAALGADAATVRSKVLQVLEGGGQVAPDRGLWSPAVSRAMAKASGLAASGAVTTGHVLRGLMADPESQAAKTLAALGLAPDRIDAALATVALGGTTDAPPAPKRVQIKLGDAETTIHDPALAEALTHLTEAELLALLRRGARSAPDGGAPDAGGPDGGGPGAGTAADGP